MSTRITFETSGLDMTKFDQLDAKAKAANMQQIVLAGAEAAEKVWRDEITSRGYISTRSGAQHMVDAVGHTEPEANAYGIHCEVYPLGDDDKGVRQRAKAGYIESKPRARRSGVYGHHVSPDKRYRGTQGKKFINGSGGINKRAVPAAQEAMAAKFNELMGE